MDWQSAVPSILAVFITGVLALLGNRYLANKSTEAAKAQTEVDQRKVDQEAFNIHLKEYERDRIYMRERLEDREKDVRRIEAKLDDTDRKLMIAVVCLKKTRTAFLDGQDLPVFPPELRAVQTWRYEEQEEGGTP